MERGEKNITTPIFYTEENWGIQLHTYYGIFYFPNCGCKFNFVITHVAVSINDFFLAVTGVSCHGVLVMVSVFLFSLKNIPSGLIAHDHEVVMLPQFEQTTSFSDNCT